MSKVMTATQWIDLLDKWGIRHVPIEANWSTHNRVGHGEFGDMHGIVVHHTGDHTSTANQNANLWDGYPSLPGPLCHAGIQVDGTVALAGWGRANHAGLGDSSVLNHVIQEDYANTGNLHPTKADTDGNAVFYGFEIEYDGITPMSDAQRKTIVRVCAAICTEHNWSAKSVIGHGEWQPGKWDPGAHGSIINMADFRNEVAQAIKEGPSGTVNSVIVAKGDTFSSLAEKYFPNSSNPVFSLVDLNPQLLQPGMKLRVK